MRTPLTYYGGKQQLASRILSMMPKHKIYCEPFFGGGAVFFAKPKSYLEVINDTNDRLITFYQQTQTNFSQLQKMIQQTLTSERMYYEAKDIYNNRIPSNELLTAWSVWMITNGSFSASMHGGWKWCNGSAGSHTGVFMRNKRNEFNEKLHDRLSDVQISCRDALDVIIQRDSPDTFFYIDPPYPGHCQGHYNGYTFVDLYNLLEKLTKIKGKFILSNMWCQTLRFFVAKYSWHVDRIDMPMKVANFSVPGGRRKTEILIRNFGIQKTLFQQ